MNDGLTNRMRGSLLAIIGVSFALSACDRGRDLFAAPPFENVVDPRTILGFEYLYGTNCAGCHGAKGEGGPAVGLASPRYLSIVSDSALRGAIALGRRGTAMPAFAQSAGGMLSDAQVDALVAGVRAWAPKGEKQGPLASVCDRPSSGDARRGARAFGDACGSCHGVDGRGSKGVGSIVDESFLALVSDSSLCATYVAGRPDLGCPGAPSIGASRPTAEDVTDGVAWIATHRKKPGREPIRSARAEMRKQ